MTIAKTEMTTLQMVSDTGVVEGNSPYQDHACTALTTGFMAAVVQPNRQLFRVMFSGSAPLFCPLERVDVVEADAAA